MQTLAAELGQTIRRYRLATGLSQERLAEAADVHRNEIGVVERGEHSVSVDVLVRIARALDVPAWVIVKEAEEGVARR